VRPEQEIDMHKLITTGRRCILAAALLGAGLNPSMAASVAFNTHVDGQSDIVGVLDPTGPVVQIQTVASGQGSLGAMHYFSADAVNLGTGRGAGHNRFVAADGSELFGIFTVQLVPTADPSVLELFGDVDFTGGSGRFAGADGFAHFSGVGSFVSATTALSRFDFDVELLLVPEPSSVTLILAALVAARYGRRRIV
jgi:hypothetical protein